MNIETIQKLLQEKIRTLEIQVKDDSAKHKGHAGAQSGGGHYKLLIVSNDFEGMNSIQRHRKIYDALNMGQSTLIHALAISAWTEKEWKQKNVHSG